MSDIMHLSCRHGHKILIAIKVGDFLNKLCSYHHLLDTIKYYQYLPYRTLIICPKTEGKKTFISFDSRAV